MFSLPKIYPITDTQLSGRTHAQLVAEFAAAGAQIVQIRDKNATEGEFFRHATESVAAARRLSVRLIVNDRVDIAIAVGADGVHLGQNDLSPAEARRLLGPGKIIGYSTHSVFQAMEAVKFPIDYVAIGPIFDTKTKQNPDPVVGLEGIKAVRRVIGSLPLVAIGGIDGQNLNEILTAGANSAAIISALYKSGRSPAENYQFLLSFINNDKQF